MAAAWCRQRHGAGVVPAAAAVVVSSIVADEKSIERKRASFLIFLGLLFRVFTLIGLSAPLATYCKFANINTCY